MVNILEGGRDMQKTQEKLASTADVIPVLLESKLLKEAAPHNVCFN